MLIAFSGKMGVGKNHIAERVLPTVLSKYLTNIQYYYLAFGDQMKVELACRKPELSYNLLFEEKTKDVRKMLQEYGTENGRNVHGENVWIRSLGMWIDIFKHRTPTKNNIFVVTDVRFKNEAKWIEERNGILIRVESHSRNTERLHQERSHELEKHISETDLDDYAFKNVINNEVNQDVEKQLNDIIHKAFVRHNIFTSYMKLEKD